MTMKQLYKILSILCFTMLFSCYAEAKRIDGYGISIELADSFVVEQSFPNNAMITDHNNRRYLMFKTGTTEYSLSEQQLINFKEITINDLRANGLDIYDSGIFHMPKNHQGFYITGYKEYMRVVIAYIIMHNRIYTFRFNSMSQNNDFQELIRYCKSVECILRH